MVDYLSIIEALIPIVALIFGVLWYRIKYGKLPETAEERDEAIATSEKFKGIVKELKSFYDPTAPMDKTSIETIKEYVPANSYQMSAESQANVLSHCSSEEEKKRVLAEIYNWENPTVTGEECCDYLLVTSGGTFHVQYGIPELVKGDAYKYLTQQQIADIVEYLGEIPKTMYEILKNERVLKEEYVLEGAGGKTAKVSKGNVEYN